MALEPINYTTHSREIEQEYLKVVRGIDEDTTWLIISPNNKKEYTPEYVGSDFSDFLSSFEESKVQFGLARVSPPGSDVKKLILVGWCPDSAPLKTKASFAANFATVANQLLKGYHIQVTARDEDDLDEAELLQKVSNAAGARYSIQMNNVKSTNKPAASSFKPPKTVNKPVSLPAPVTEVEAKSPVMNASKVKVGEKSPPQEPTPKPSTSGTDDWDEPEVEERDFNHKPLKPATSSYKPVGKVDLQKVIAEENAKEDPRLVNTSGSYKRIEPQNDIAQLKEKSKLKRDQEMNAFLGTKPPVFSSIPQKNDDFTIKGFKNEKSPAQLWAEKKASKNGQNNSQQEPARTEEEPVEENEEFDVQDLKSKFEKFSATTEPPIISPRPVTNKTVTNQESSAPTKTDPSKFGTPLPGMHVELKKEKEEEEEEEDDWDEEEEPESTHSPDLHQRDSYNKSDGKGEESNYQKQQEDEPAEEDNSFEEKEPIEEEEQHEKELPADEESVPPLPSRNTAAPPPPARRSVEPPKPTLPSAIAEYDYEAGEDNELTFTESDRIINIDFVDDDWWLGELEKSGEKGLFPSNYVSLEN